ncbi:hypothetical protein [Micromonospora sp. NPDC048063]|uniref:hypothetical protein n=1 Tax=Micromonospora sp. NPDC048063 TaxID=3364256 RepID=UPI00371D6B5A
MSAGWLPGLTAAEACARVVPLPDEQFGTERLVHALTGCHRMPAPALAERVEQVTCDWLAHGDHDDIAVLALRAAGPGERTPRHLHAVPVPTGSADAGETGP